MLRRRLRLSLTVLGIALGVSAVVSIRMVNRTILQSYHGAIDRIAGTPGLEIVSLGPGFAEELLQVTESLEGVEASQPLVEGFLSIAGPRVERLLVLGVDLVKGGIVGGAFLDSITFSHGDPQTFIANGDSIALAETLAKELNLSIGSRLSLMTVDGIRHHTVRALIPPGELSQAYGGRVAVMDLPVAQSAFGKQGKLTRIVLKLRDASEADRIEERLRGLVGAGVDVIQPRQRGKPVDSLSSSFRIGLSFVSFLTLVVGLFLVANTSRISVAERQKETGTLRALGARRKEIVELFLLEAFLVGCVASVLGVGVGWLMAKASLRLVAETVEGVFFKADLGRLRVSPWDFVIGGAAGVLTTLAGTLVAALRAASVAPAKVLAARGFEGENGKGLGRASRAAGFFFIVLAALEWLMIPTSLPGTARFTLGMVGAFFVLVGLSFFSVQLLKGMSALLTPFLERRSSLLGRVATHGALNNAERSGITITTLVLSLATILTIAVLALSIRRSLERWVEQVVTADLVVTSSSGIPGPLSTPLADNIGETLDRKSVV